MAHIQKRNGKWQAAYRGPDKRERTKTFRVKADAERWLDTQGADIARGQWIDPSAGKVTFRAYAEQWRTVQVHRPTTASQIETHLRRHVYPRIGDRPIGGILRSDVQSLVKVLSDGLAPATVEVIYAWVSSIFKSAAADRVIGVTPCRGIKLPTVARTKVAPLEAETVAQVAQAVPERYRALIILGAGTGLRISEALGLTIGRTDLMRKKVTIDQQLVGIEDGSPVFGPVKDRHNTPRAIPLPQTVALALAEHIRLFGARTPAEPGDLLFTDVDGAPIRRSRWSEIWRAAADPVGLPKGTGFHALRHHYASTLIRAGESVKVVQERLGHTSATMTLDVYGHLFPDDEDRTRGAVDAILGPALRALRSA
jgi:integrase